MPHTPSAFKRLRQNEVRRQRNLAAMRAIKTSFPKAEPALKADPAKAQDALKQAVALLDRWSAKGLLHRNTAARRKSRLMLLLNAAKSSASAASARPVATKAKVKAKAKAEAKTKPVAKTVVKTDKP